MAAKHLIVAVLAALVGLSLQTDWEELLELTHEQAIHFLNRGHLHTQIPAAKAEQAGDHGASNSHIPILEEFQIGAELGTTFNIDWHSRYAAHPLSAIPASESRSSSFSPLGPNHNEHVGPREAAPQAADMSDPPQPAVKPSRLLRMDLVSFPPPTPLSGAERIQLLQHAGWLLSTRSTMRRYRIFPFSGRFLSDRLVMEIYPMTRTRWYEIDKALFLSRHPRSEGIHFAETEGGMMGAHDIERRMYLWKRSAAQYPGGVTYHLIGMIESRANARAALSPWPSSYGSNVHRVQVLGSDSIFDSSVRIQVNKK